MEKVVIIGAGQAGGWCAKALRDAGFLGELSLVGNESLPPYERPPLSKGVLDGSERQDVCFLFPDGGASLNLSAHWENPATAIDRTRKAVTLQSGEELYYDKLVLATGGQARTLPGVQGPNIFLLRTLRDSLALKQQLQPGKSLLVIGGGWIGLEVAATATKAGLQVTIVEPQNRLCARSVPSVLSDYLHALHTRQGVEILLSASLAALQASEEGIAWTLADDSVRSADLVVVGVGLVPNVALAASSGLEVDNGVVVNSCWQTSDPEVFAIGDVAHRQNSAGVWQRLESWANAMKSAEDVAHFLMTGKEPAEAIPWFWSDQYGNNIQILGTPDGWENPIFRGDQSAGTFTVWFEEEQHLQAVISVNQSKDIKVAKRLMERHIRVSRSELENPELNLKMLLKK